MQYYFVNTKINDFFVLQKDDIHHILDVMRMHNGDEIVVVYESKKYLCNLEIADKTVIPHLKQEIIDNSMLNKKITLIYAIPKGDKFELVLQKATELGVNRIVPLLSSRCVVKYDDSDVARKLSRWEKILKEASEQSRRSSIPEIIAPIKVNQLKDYLSDINFTGDENFVNSNVVDFNDILMRKPNNSISVIVGAEGGFSKEEFEFFRQIGFQSVSFGSRILRSETAAIYILSVLAYFCEWQASMKNEL